MIGFAVDEDRSLETLRQSSSPMRMGLSEYEDDEFKADMSEGTVLDRLATPEEIAKKWRCSLQARMPRTALALSLTSTVD